MTKTGTAQATECETNGTEGLLAELDAAKRALVEIARGPLMPLPDPGAHSWRAFGEAAYRAMTEGMRKASAALAAKSTEQKEDE